MRLLKNFRIKNKIIIIIILIGTVSAIAGNTINYLYELHNTKERLIENSVLQAKLIAENCWLPLEFNYKKNAVEALQKLHAIPEVQDATLFNLSDSIFASYSKSGNNHIEFPVKLKASDFYIDGDNLFIKQTVSHNEKIYGTIYLHSNINWTTIVTSRLLLSFAMVAVMMLLIIAFAFILQGTISKPIIELSHQMSVVAEKKDYTVKLKNTDQDEIGELYSEFNNMLAEINTRQTDLKSAYSALETNERWLSTIMEKTPLPIAMMNEDGSISFRNERFVKLFGYTQDDAPTVADWFQMAYPDEEYRQWVIETWGDAVKSALENNKDIQSNEYIIACKDGRKLNVLISGIMLNNKLLATFIDLTEIKKKEVALQESEQMFSDMAANAAGVIFRLYARKDGAIGLYYLSPKADEILGISIGSNGQDWQLGKFIHPDDKEGYLFEVKQAIAEIKDFKCEFRIITSLGEKWIQFLARPTIKTNEVVFNGIIIDISERKNAERELEKYSEKLEELVDARTEELNYSLSQIKAAMNSTVDGILIVNREGHITLWNQKFIDIWQVPSKLLNTEVKDPILNYVAQQIVDPDAFLTKVMELYAHPDVVSEDVLNLADGRIFERYSQPQQIGDNIVGRVWSFRNITEQKQAEENLRKAKELAESANKAKSIFLANMTHEIRTPMNAVLGFAQLLERDASLSIPSRTKVSTIIKSGEHLLGIINDILEVSRIEAGRIELRNESVDLHNLLNDLAVMFRLQAETKGLSFTLEINADLPRYIIADLGKVRQIIINLLGNAVKFTPKGSVCITASSLMPDIVCIAVKDSGIGISSEDRNMIFKPFERTRSGEQAAGGTGLGLVISREYAHSMNGEITFKSEVNQGSTFEFSFHAPMTVMLPTSATITQKIIAVSPNQGEIRVLIVDDQATNRELLRCLLEPLGFTIEEAISGVEAIAKTTNFTPRIILMDMVMPNMNGIEATKTIRLTCSKDLTTIIGISASAFDTEKQNFLDAGINAFIAKPFREQELFDILKKHAGIKFETEETHYNIAKNQANELTLNKMSQQWNEAFSKALAQGSITQIRILGEEARVLDPLLSAFILEHVTSYDINGLKKLC